MTTTELRQEIGMDTISISSQQSAQYKQEKVFQGTHLEQIFSGVIYEEWAVFLLTDGKMPDITTTLPHNFSFEKRDEMLDAETLKPEDKMLIVSAHIAGDFSDFTCPPAFPTTNIDAWSITVGEAGAGPYTGADAVKTRLKELTFAGASSEIYEEQLAKPKGGINFSERDEKGKEITIYGQLIHHDGELVTEVQKVTESILNKLKEYEPDQFPKVIMTHSPKLSKDFVPDHPDHFVVYVALMRALEKLKEENYYNQHPTINPPAVYTFDLEFTYPSGVSSKGKLAEAIKSGKIGKVYIPQFKIDNKTGHVIPAAATIIDLSQVLESQFKDLDPLNQELLTYPLNIPHFTMDVTPYLPRMIAALYSNRTQMNKLDDKGKITGEYPYIWKIPLVWYLRGITSSPDSKGAQAYQHVITPFTSDQNLLANSSRTDIYELAYGDRQ